MDLNTSKNIGGIGALLLFITILPYVNIINFFGLVSLIGVIMLLVAAKGLADHYREGGIFNNAIYGVILAIVGVVAFAAALAYAVVNLFAAAGFNFSAFDFTNFANFAQMDWTGFASLAFSDLMGFFGAFIVALVVLFIFVVIAAVFFRKSMSLTAKKTGVGLFGTAGMLLLIGAVLTIIVFGIFLMWISLLLIAIAFFQIKAEPAQTQVPPPPTM